MLGICLFRLEFHNFFWLNLSKFLMNFNSFFSNSLFIVNILFLYICQCPDICESGKEMIYSYGKIGNRLIIRC